MQLLRWKDTEENLLLALDKPGKTVEEVAEAFLLLCPGRTSPQGVMQRVWKLRRERYHPQNVEEDVGDDSELGRALARARAAEQTLAKLRDDIARLERSYCISNDLHLKGESEVGALDQALVRLTSAVQTKFQLKHRRR
jgi:hypothetical protein